MTACWLCGFSTTVLTTNVQAPTCRNGPCQICIRVAALDEEINQAVAVLQHLLLKRCDLRSEQNHTHDLMRRLPIELRNYIFELALPMRDQWGEVIYRKGYLKVITPSYLASICRDWRDTAWSNPSLWTSLRVAFGSQTSAPRHRRTNQSMLRSRPLPFSLDIAIYTDVGLEEELKSFLQVDHYQRVKRLRVDSSPRFKVPLFSPEMSPETIDIYGVSFLLLNISWNNLTSATLDGFDWEDIVQIFQNAPRMIYCWISNTDYRDEHFSTPAIIHGSLKTLRLHHANTDVVATLLRSLTLPSLQEFHAADMIFLTPAYLPALVHRSSCLLTNLTIDCDGDLIGVQPMPGVSDLVLEDASEDENVNEQFLFEGYLPDLRHLTLRLKAFYRLWLQGLVAMLLDLKGPRSNADNEGRLHRFLVVEPDHPSRIDQMWDSHLGEQLKGMDIRLRDDGFEFL